MKKTIWWVSPVLNTNTPCGTNPSHVNAHTTHRDIIKKMELDIHLPMHDLYDQLTPEMILSEMIK